MTRALRTLVVVSLTALAFSSNAWAAAGNYVVDGGTVHQRAQVKAALDASAFNWSLVPAQIKIHVRPGIQSRAVRGRIWIDSRLLDAGRYGWGIVQHEYAHQVDWYLLNAATRSRLFTVLGGKAWCWNTPGFDHHDYGCERFASTLAWSYWPAADSALRPQTRHSESAAIAPAKFRRLMGELLGPTALSVKRG